MAGGKGKAFFAKSFDDLRGGDFVDKLSEETCHTGKRDHFSRLNLRRLKLSISC